MIFKVDCEKLALGSVFTHFLHAFLKFFYLLDPHKWRVLKRLHLFPNALIDPNLHLLLHKPLDHVRILPLTSQISLYHRNLLAKKRAGLLLEIETLDCLVTNVNNGLGCVHELL